MGEKSGKYIKYYFQKSILDLGRQSPFLSRTQSPNERYTTNNQTEKRERSPTKQQLHMGNKMKTESRLNNEERLFN